MSHQPVSAAHARFLNVACTNIIALREAKFSVPLDALHVLFRRLSIIVSEPLSFSVWRSHMTVMTMMMTVVVVVVVSRQT